MLEAAMAHLRLLKRQTDNGDIITGEDLDFVMKTENNIQIMQNNICAILANRPEKEKNL